MVGFDDDDLDFIAEQVARETEELAREVEEMNQNLYAEDIVAQDGVSLE